MGDVKEESYARKGYLEWDEYFMATAMLAGQRSKDPVTQVGACIVNEDRKIVGIGYNGLPFGCSDFVFPWCKDPEDPLKNKHTFVCHAEVNAILNKNCLDLKGCTLYVALFPCNECAKVIIQSRIKNIVYLSDKHHHKSKTIASKLMLDAAKIPYKRFVPQNRKIVIDFDEIDQNVIGLSSGVQNMAV